MRKSTSLVCTVFLVAAAAVAAASPNLVSHPDPSRSFTERFDWALASAPRDGGFWIAYSIERWMPPGTFFNGGWTWRQRHGAPLTDLLAGRMSGDDKARDDGQVHQEIAILLGYPSTGAAPESVSVASMNVPVNWQRRPILWLGPTPTEKSFARLTNLYRRSKSDAFKEDLMDAAGMHDLPGAVDFLAEVLGSRDNANIREEAAEALAWQTEPRALTVLVRTAERDASVGVREEAVEALGEIEIEGAVEALIELARHADHPQVREEAVESLAETGAPAAIAVLEDLLWHDGDVRIQEEALDALAELPQERAVPILIETARNHPSAGVREEAVEHLAEVAAERAVTVLEEVATNDRSFAVRAEALEILGELPGGAGLPFVVKIARTHPDNALRAEAIDVLADSDDPRARRALQMWASE